MESCLAGSDSGALNACVKDRVAYGGIADDFPSPTARNFFEFWNSSRNLRRRGKPRL